jgi:hypothetical protein
VSDECVETIRASFVRSPTKSTRRASRELLLPRSTIHKVLHNIQFFKTPSGLCGPSVYRSVAWLHTFFFVIPFYLQSVPVHSANCIKTYTIACKKGAHSSSL